MLLSRNTRAPWGKVKGPSFPQGCTGCTILKVMEQKQMWLDITSSNELYTATGKANVTTNVTVKKRPIDRENPAD